MAVRVRVFTLHSHWQVIPPKLHANPSRLTQIRKHTNTHTTWQWPLLSVCRCCMGSDIFEFFFSFAGFCGFRVLCNWMIPGGRGGGEVLLCSFVFRILQSSNKEILQVSIVFICLFVGFLDFLWVLLIYLHLVCSWSYASSTIRLCYFYFLFVLNCYFYLFGHLVINNSSDDSISCFNFIMFSSFFLLYEQRQFKKYITNAFPIFFIACLCLMVSSIQLFSSVWACFLYFESYLIVILKRFFFFLILYWYISCSYFEQ